MNFQKMPSFNLSESLTVAERWASLLGRTIIYFIMVYVPLIFFTWTWRHYHVPKVASFQYLVLVLLACWGVIAVRRRMVRSVIATPAAFFFMIVMVTSLGAVNLTESWETILFIASCMIFLVLIPKFLTRFKDFEILVYLLGMMCLVVDLYALGQWFGWEEMFVWTEKLFNIRQLTPKPVSFMGNENYAAEFLNMTLPVCFAMMLCYRRKPAQLIFFTFVTLINCIVMVYIDCNASFAGFIVAIPIATVLIIYFKAIPWSRKVGLFQLSRDELEHRFRKLMILGLLFISLFATLVAAVPNGLRTKMASMASWMDVDGDLIPDGVAPIVFRLQCMDAAARNIMDSPIMGIGAGNFKVIHPLYESQLERKVLGEETLARKVHNDHLYHAVEFGIFGLFGWYWIIAASFFAILGSLRLLEYQALSAAVKEKKTTFYKGRILPVHVREFYFYLQWGILTGLIVAVVSCAFGHTFVISSSAIIYWLLTGVCVAIFQNLHFASKGMRNNLIGITPEPINPVQKQTRMIPGFAWTGLFFVIIIPLGIFNTYQLIGETWLRHGMTENTEKNYYGMFKCFDKVMEYYPYQMETYYILGRYYIDAIVDLELAASANQLDTAVQKGLDPATRRKMNEEGIVILQADLFMNPNYKWAHNNLGVLYDRYYDLIKSEPQDNVGPLFGVSPEPEQALAVMQASKKTYNRVLEIDREQIYAHFNLGLGAIKQNELDKAVEPLNRALITDPSRYDIYKYLSQCFTQNKDYKRAMRAAEKYLEKVILLTSRKSVRTQKDLDNYRNIMQTLRENDYSKAVDLARLFSNFRDADSYNLFIGIASELINGEKFDRELTKEAVDMAVKINSNPKPEHYLWHAKIYEKLEDNKNASEQLEGYLRVQPDDDGMRHSLMLIYVKMNDLEHAKNVMATLLSKHSNNWQYLITYARLLAGTKTSWPQIFPYVKKSIELGGDEARRLVSEDQPGNLVLPFVKQDPRMRDLLGPSFLPAQQ